MQARDPVCNMFVDTDNAKYKTQYKNHVYYFCNPKCLHKFEQAPETYLRPRPKTEPTKEAATTIYTCPMHPEIQQRGPGDCPLCGMALEPIGASEEDNTELKDFTWRFGLAVMLSIPLLYYSMIRMHDHSSYSLQLVLAAIVTFVSGWPILKKGVKSFINWQLNMFSLIAVGTLVAYFFSAYVVFFYDTLPQQLRHVYFESSAVIISLVLLGQMLEQKARQRTRGALRALMDLTPPKAFLLAPNGEVEVDLTEVKVGDRLRVKPGGKVPVDGKIVNGDSTINEAMVTGESLPVEKSAKDKVIAGTINLHGSFEMVAEKIGSETLLAQIVTLVAQAQYSRAPVQTKVDKVSAVFVPLVFFTSLLTFLLWITYGPDPKFALALVNAISVLIIACPCALGLATPMSIMVAIGRAAQNGILIKDAKSLETLDSITALAFDKTGTLTLGHPAVTNIICDPGKEETILQLAASIEALSEHPIAKAIVDEAKSRGIKFFPAAQFKTLTGLGVVSHVAGREVLLGSQDHVATKAKVSDFFIQKTQELRRQGTTVIFLSMDGVVKGLIGVADPIKDSARAAIRYFRSRGVKVLMISGDHEETARAIADKLGIKHFYANTLPSKKLEIIKEWQSKNEVIAMAGDGINDAPALSQADVGIAMGNGTDVAMQSAGITLIKGDLQGIQKAHTLSKITNRNIKQNLLFAFAYNFLGVPVAAGLLYPLNKLLLTPMLASLAMTFSSVSVIANALRLRTVNLLRQS